MLTRRSVRRRVARGASLLDALFPGWYRKVNLSKLNMVEHTECVLGQLFGYFDETGDHYKGRKMFHAVMTADKNKFAHFGFTSDGRDNSDEYWDALYDYWVYQIKRRKGVK